MAPRKQQQAQSIGPLIVAAGIGAAGYAAWQSYPSLPIVWLALLIAAWAEPAPLLTGPKDSNAQPTAAGPGERRRLRSWRFWTMLRWRLLGANTALLPGWPIRADAVYAAVLAAGASQLPVRQSQWMWVNIGAVWVVITAVFAARRRTMNDVEVFSGVRIDSLPRVFGKIPVVLAAVVAGGGAFWATSTYGDNRVDLPLAAVLSAAIAGLVVIGPFWYLEGTRSWKIRQRARAEWEPRWEALKIKPAGHLVDREFIGGAIVDTIDSPPSVGAQSLTAPTFAPKLRATADPGAQEVVLDTPNHSADGSEIPGTRHPRRVKVASWPVGSFPDLTDPTLDRAAVRLAAQAGFVEPLDQLGYARPVLVSVDNIADESSPVALWASKWAWPDGPDLKVIRVQLGTSELTGWRTPFVLIDHKADNDTGVVYFGAAPAEEMGLTPALVEHFAQLAEEDAWADRWSQVLKTGSEAPTVYHNLTNTWLVSKQAAGRRLPGAQPEPVGVAEIEQRVFLSRQGVDPNDFKGMEPKLATTLSAAGMCAVCSVPDGGEIGSRHPQATSVIWSNDSIPDSPVQLPPTDARHRARDGSPMVLRWLMNNAFDAARMARPEFMSSRPLSKASSGAHLWESKWRLYGGVTASKVRAQQTSLAVNLRVPYLRIIEDGDDAVTVIAGADWHQVELANKRRDVVRLTRLDWTAAFVHARVTSPTTGEAPYLQQLANHPTMPGVQVGRFSVPPGLSLADVRKKVEAITASWSARYLAIREVENDPSLFDVLWAGQEWTDPLEELPPVPFGPDVTVDIHHGPQVGWTEEGEPWRWQIYGVHTVAAAASGHGKGSWLWGIVRGIEPLLVEGSVVLWGIDLKGGVEMAKCEAAWARVAGTPSEALDLLYDAAAVLDHRLAEMKGKQRSIDPSPETPMYLVLIDEMASLNYMAESDKQRKEVGKLLSTILSRGRAAAVNICGFLQDPSKESLRQRDLFTRRVGGRLDNGDMIDRLLGDGARDAGANLDKIPKTGFGVAYLTTDKRVEPIRVRAPFTTDDDLTDLDRRLEGKIPKFAGVVATDNVGWGLPPDPSSHWTTEPQPGRPGDVPAPDEPVEPDTAPPPRDLPTTLDDLDF